MADDFKVYKTRCTVNIGFSIEQTDAAGNHSWEKSGVAIETESGPGYPSKETLAYMMGVQMRDAVDACDEQISEIAARITGKATS